MQGPVAPPHFSNRGAGIQHWSRAGPVMFSICRLGTRHHRVSPGFCLLVSRAKARGTAEEQLPYSSVSTVYFMWTKQDFSEVYKRNLLGEKKKARHHLSSFPLSHIFKFWWISNVTFSQELFPTPSPSWSPWRTHSILHCVTIVYLHFSRLKLCPLDWNSSKENMHYIF